MVVLVLHRHNISRVTRHSKRKQPASLIPRHQFHSRRHRRRGRRRFIAFRCGGGGYSNRTANTLAVRNKLLGKFPIGLHFFVYVCARSPGGVWVKCGGMSVEDKNDNGRRPFSAEIGMKSTDRNRTERFGQCGPFDVSCTTPIDE